MPRISCPHCKHVISATEEQRGTIIVCVKCSRRIKVPAAKPAAATPAAVKGEESGARRGAGPSRPAPPALTTPKRPAAERPRPGTDADDFNLDDAARPPLPRPAPSARRPPPPPAEEDLVEVEDDFPTPRKAFPRPAGKRPSPPEDELIVEHVEEVPSAKRATKRAERTGDEAGDEEPADRPTRKKKKRKKRRKANMAVGIFGGIGSLLFLGLFILIVTGKWVDILGDSVQTALENAGIHPLIALGITALVLFVPIGLYYFFTIKSSILAAMPDEIDFRPAKAAEYEELDLKKLSKLTAVYEDLGFDKVMDYKPVMDVDNGITGFARLMWNAQESCYAEINQGFFADGSPVPMRSVVMSVLDDRWTVSTTDREPNAENYIMRRPKAPWESRPDDEPEQLLEAHLKLRKRMVRDLEIDVLSDGSADTYFESEQKAVDERKQAVRRRWAFGLLYEMWTFDSSPKYKWLGSYAKKAKRKGDE
jgi:hypothetical protein